MTSLLHFELCSFHVALSQLNKSRLEWTLAKENLPFQTFENRRLEGPKHAKLPIKTRVIAFMENVSG